MEEYIQITENKEKENLLKEETEKSYSMINDMKELIKKYEETSNTKIIQDVVSIYVNQLLPLIKKKQETKYNKNIVEYNSENNTYHLKQEKYSLEDISVRYSKPEIVHFTIGIGKKNKIENSEIET